MNCRHACDGITFYIDGELSLEECLLLEKHLRSCASCRARLHTEREEKITTQKMLTAFPRIQPSPDFDRHVLDAVLQREMAPTFFDKLDRYFARPVPKLVGSSIIGMSLCLLMIIAFVPRSDSQTEILKPRFATLTPPKINPSTPPATPTVSSYYALNASRFDDVNGLPVDRRRTKRRRAEDQKIGRRSEALGTTVPLV